MTRTINELIYTEARGDGSIIQDKEENERSRAQMRAIQKYLDEQSEYIFSQ